MEGASIDSSTGVITFTPNAVKKDALGQQTLRVKVKYSDNSEDLVEVPITVKDKTQATVTVADGAIDPATKKPVVTVYANESYSFDVKAVDNSESINDLEDADRLNKDKLDWLKSNSLAYQNAGNRQTNRGKKGSETNPYTIHYEGTAPKTSGQYTSRVRVWDSSDNNHEVEFIVKVLPQKDKYQDLTSNAGAEQRIQVNKPFSYKPEDFVKAENVQKLKNLNNGQSVSFRFKNNSVPRTNFEGVKPQDSVVSQTVNPIIEAVFSDGSVAEIQGTLVIEDRENATSKLVVNDTDKRVTAETTATSMPEIQFEIGSAINFKIETTDDSKVLDVDLPEALPNWLKSDDRTYQTANNKANRGSKGQPGGEAYVTTFTGTTPKTPGEYTIKIRSWDGANKSHITQFKIVVKDTTAPNINVELPLKDNINNSSDGFKLKEKTKIVYRGESFEYYVTATDNSDNLKEFTVWRDAKHQSTTPTWLNKEMIEKDGDKFRFKLSGEVPNDVGADKQDDFSGKNRYSHTVVATDLSGNSSPRSEGHYVLRIWERTAKYDVAYASNQVANTGSTLTIQAPTFTDISGETPVSAQTPDRTSYELVNSVEGASIDSSTGVITFTPNAVKKDALGQQTLRVKVKYSDNSEDLVEVPITIKDKTQATVTVADGTIDPATKKPVVTVYANESYSFDVKAVDNSESINDLEDADRLNKNKLDWLKSNSLAYQNAGNRQTNRGKKGSETNPYTIHYEGTAPKTSGQYTSRVRVWDSSDNNHEVEFIVKVLPQKDKYQDLTSNAGAEQRIQVNKPFSYKPEDFVKAENVQKLKNLNNGQSVSFRFKNNSVPRTNFEGVKPQDSVVSQTVNPIIEAVFSDGSVAEIQGTLVIEDRENATSKLVVNDTDKRVTAETSATSMPEIQFEIGSAINFKIETTDDSKVLDVDLPEALPNWLKSDDRNYQTANNKANRGSKGQPGGEAYVTTFTGTTPKTPGEYTIKIRSWDGANKSHITQFKIVVKDTTAPNINVELPLKDNINNSSDGFKLKEKTKIVYRGESFEYYVTATDNSDNLKEFTVWRDAKHQSTTPTWLNKEMIEKDGDKFRFKLSGEVPNDVGADKQDDFSGKNRYSHTVVATDLSGNSSPRSEGHYVLRIWERTAKYDVAYEGTSAGQPTIFEVQPGKEIQIEKTLSYTDISKEGDKKIAPKPDRTNVSVNSVPNGLKVEIGEDGKMKITATESLANTTQDLTVTVTYSDGSIDTVPVKIRVGKQVKNTEDLVEKAEKAYAELDKAIKDAGDLVTPDELAGLQDKLAKAKQEKQAAQDAVTALPETVKDQKDGFQGRLDKLVDPTLPTVNDADNNGIADDVDKQVANAKDLVEKAEKAYAELDKAIKDAGDLVTPDELAGLQDKLAKAKQEKQAAQDAVTALPETVKDQKDGFQGRLDKLVDPTLPTVNDADNNGIADDVDKQVANAKDLVEKIDARKATKELPNTGTVDSTVAMVAAAASAVLGLGLAGRRRKEDEEA